MALVPYRVHDRQHDTCTADFLLCEKAAAVGQQEKGGRQVLQLLSAKGREGRKLQEKAGRGIYVALLLFVGIPLPGTGAWTGTLAASILDLDFKKSTLAVVLGVLLAGIIMTVVSQVVKGGFALF